MKIELSSWVARIKFCIFHIFVISFWMVLSAYPLIYIINFSSSWKGWKNSKSTVLYFFSFKKKGHLFQSFTALWAICLERNTEWKLHSSHNNGLWNRTCSSNQRIFYGTQTKHKGCYFHYTQALRKNYVNCGLDKAEFKANVFHRRFYKSFKCLAFIHSMNLDDAFSQIKEAYYNKYINLIKLILTRLLSYRNKRDLNLCDRKFKN